MAMLSAVRRYVLAGFLLAVIAGDSQAQDKPTDLDPGNLPGITVLKPGEQPDTQTYISENSSGGLRLRDVARPDPADPYRHIAYLLAWRQAATGKLPVALVISDRPATKAIDLNLWRKETGPKDNGTDGHMRDFARRGYLAAWTMLTSEMNDLQYSRCQPEAITVAMERAADRIHRFLSALRNEPEADMKHVIIIANGASAIATLALAARHIDGVEAVINISGGLYLRGCDANVANDVVGKILGTGGVNRPVPSLWLYADNDEALDQMMVSGWRDAYMKGGGDVDLDFIVMGDKPGYLLNIVPSSALKVASRINGFLDHLGLPAIHESDIDKLVARLGDEKFRDRAREYLVGPSYKALAVSQSGKWIGTDFSERADVPALVSALYDCNQRSGGEDCHVLMLNNDYRQ